MSNRARRRILRNWQLGAVVAHYRRMGWVHREDFTNLADGNRWHRQEFRMIWREPLRFPNNIRPDPGLINIQARNDPDRPISLLFLVLPDACTDSPIWYEALAIDFKDADRVFYDALERLGPLKRIVRRRFDWYGWDEEWPGHGRDAEAFTLEPYQDDAEYIAPLQWAARAIRSASFCLHQHSVEYGGWVHAAKLCLCNRAELDRSLFLPFLGWKDDEDRLGWIDEDMAAYEAGRTFPPKWQTWFQKNIRPPFPARFFVRVHPHWVDRLTDSEILYLIAANEARLAAESMVELAQAIKEEADEAGIGPEDDDALERLRGRIAAWERREGRYYGRQLANARELLALADKEAAKEIAAKREAEMSLDVERGKKFSPKGRGEGPLKKLVRTTIVQLHKGGTPLSDIKPRMVWNACKTSLGAKKRKLDFYDSSVWVPGQGETGYDRFSAIVREVKNSL